MKSGILSVGAVFVVAVGILSFSMPKGWYTGGNKPKAYNMGIAKGGAHDGGNAGTIQSAEAVTDQNYGTLMQYIDPDKYVGKRIRMTGYMRSEKVTGWAGFWCRADGKTIAESMSFDNMENRAVKGTTGWQQYGIVIDVPEGTTEIAFGALIAGTGQIWFDHIQLEEVSKAIPVTGYSKRTLPYDNTKVRAKNTKEYENPAFNE